MTEHTDELARARSGIADAIEHLVKMQDEDRPFEETVGGMQFSDEEWGKAMLFIAGAAAWVAMSRETEKDNGQS